MRMSSKSLLGALAGLVLLAPVAVLAQSTPAPTETATLVVTAEDGAESTYQVTEVSSYVSTTEAYDDVPRTTDFSLSFVVSSPIDAALLNWISQAADNDKTMRDVTVTISGSGADELVYAIDGARVTSFSTTNASTSLSNGFSLSMLGDSLTINGVTMD